MTDIISPEVGDDEEEVEPAPEVERRRLRDHPWVKRVGPHLPIILLLAAIAIAIRIFYESGIDWGDDWALYINQAQGLVTGNVADVVSNNNFAVNNSGWSTFSPLIYPWGFPILIAPVVALWGVDYVKLKIVIALSFLGFLYCLYRLFERRAGKTPALLIVALLGSSILYIGWTSSITADYPYLFAAGVTLVWIDRCRTRGLFEGEAVRDLVILGLLMAYAFSVRREGAALVFSVAAVHAVSIAPRLRRRLSDDVDEPDYVPDPIRWSRLAVPYATFIVAVGALQLMLPSLLYPRFDGQGTQQFKPNIIWFRDILAEHIGLKDIGPNPLELLGSWRLAAIALAVLLSLAAIGFLARLLFATVEDMSLIAYSVALSYIVLSAPFHEGRYLLGITPLIAYFAYQALPTLTKWWKHAHRVAAVVSVVLLSGLVLANATDMRLYLKGHLRDVYTIAGPTTPAAVEMADVVKRCTRSDDVVVFFRARAMGLLTGRRSIQTGDINQVLNRGDWFMMNKGSTYSQPLIEDAQAKSLGLGKVWENGEWVLWLLPSGVAAQRNPPACPVIGP